METIFGAGEIKIFDFYGNFIGNIYPTSVTENYTRDETKLNIRYKVADDEVQDFILNRSDYEKYSGKAPKFSPLVCKMIFMKERRSGETKDSIIELASSVMIESYDGDYTVSDAADYTIEIAVLDG